MRHSVSANGTAEFRRLAEHAATLFTEREQRTFTLRTAGTVTIAEITYRDRFADILDSPTAGTLIELTGQSEIAVRNSPTAGTLIELTDRPELVVRNGPTTAIVDRADQGPGGVRPEVYSPRAAAASTS